MLIFVNMVDEFYFDERQGKSSILLLLDDRVLIKIVLTEEF